MSIEKRKAGRKSVIVTIKCTCCVLISTCVDMVRIVIVIGITIVVHRLMILVIVMIRFIDCFAAIVVGR